MSRLASSLVFLLLLMSNQASACEIPQEVLAPLRASADLVNSGSPIDPDAMQALHATLSGLDPDTLQAAAAALGRDHSIDRLQAEFAQLERLTEGETGIPDILVLDMIGRIYSGIRDSCVRVSERRANGVLGLGSLFGSGFRGEWAIGNTRIGLAGLLIFTGGVFAAIGLLVIAKRYASLLPFLSTRREHVRHGCRVPARVLANGQSLPGQVSDVGRGGVLFEAARLESVSLSDLGAPDDDWALEVADERFACTPLRSQDGQTALFFQVELSAWQEQKILSKSLISPYRLTKGHRAANLN